MAGVKHNVAGVKHNCRNFSDETMQMYCVYVPALPDDERASLAGGEDPVGLFFSRGSRGRTCLDPGEGDRERVKEVTVVVLFDEVGDDLGVGFAPEGVPLLLEVLLEGIEVLDDPVVNHDQLPAAIRVWMSINF
jgi:hypothetical protein